MSDSIKDLERGYDKIHHEQPRSIGLFPIPEYPEFEGRGMWSDALDVLLTTLRYLAPATLLTIFWGHQGFLFRILKSIDNAFRAMFSSDEQKQAVLQWLAEAGPVRVEHLDTVWRHGWILCGVLDAALPGACAGHPPTRLSLMHAQAIADHYLGVDAVFTRQELESNDSLSKHQEWKLATYLDRIRIALSKLTPPVSKPTSQRTSPDTPQVTLDYVARGSGLTAAQVNNKMYFKIYPTSQQSLDPGEITILIRGPKDTYGMVVIPPIFGKAQLIRNKLIGLQSKTNYTETALPITQGATYMRSYGRNDMNKTYFIPKSKYDIEIEEDLREDHAKIGYLVQIPGKYEISITSHGLHIIGSPFTMTASKNIIKTLERDSFCLEDGEEIDIVDVKTDKKVVLRIVDFVTEKMLLRENGSLEKISDDDARILMYNEKWKRNTPEDKTTIDSLLTEKPKNFQKVAKKVVQMNKVCKIIRDFNDKKDSKRESSYTRVRNKTSDVPDIVNSTFSDSQHNSFIPVESKNRFIIPENISVSLMTEKSKPLDSKDKENLSNSDNSLHTSAYSNSPHSLDKYEMLERQVEKILEERPALALNPFLNDDLEENYAIEKDLRSFVQTEYETNKSDSEETDNAPIKILIDDSSVPPSPSPIKNINPFVEPDILNLERPKTPILKIITGEVKNRADSLYVDPAFARLAEEDFSNEFINPFYIHHHSTDEDLPVTDFIIGAPVSLPPNVRPTTPQPNLDYLINTTNYIVFTSDKTREQDNKNKAEDNIINGNASSVFSTPLHTNPLKLNPPTSSTFHSFDSNVSDEVEIIDLPNINQPMAYNFHIEPQLVTTKKDLWDSAYVSIDDSNSSPDSNNNDNTTNETANKSIILPTDVNYEYLHMGPAEREMWQTCSDLKDVSRVHEEVKSTRAEIKRSLFTPIIEESDRSISSSVKDNIGFNVNTKLSETDPVTVAFAEINDIYKDYFPNSGQSSITTNPEEDKNVMDTNYTVNINKKGVSVDSASNVLDVKRHAAEIEGKISEVQANVTESGSVSQTLHPKTRSHNHYTQSLDENLLGDKSHTNIVLERKQYWDDKIREIEAKSQECKAQTKRRRLSSKNLRLNDSLTKKRGKQMVKHFLNSSAPEEYIKPIEIQNNNTEVVNKHESEKSNNEIHHSDSSKLVEKWKKYWDVKLETEKDDKEISCFKTKSPKHIENKSSSPQITSQNNDDIIEVYKEEVKDRTLPAKQELPEEVFKAFETSPKRFFGTSRKQILNKIDTFLGKPSTADESLANVSGATPDTSLVSSRISLFHSISKTEEPWSRRKCQSMQNISQRKDSEKSVASIDEKIICNKSSKVTSSQQNIFTSAPVAKKNHTFKKIQSNNREIDNKIVKSFSTDTCDVSLKEKRARMTQHVYHKTVDETSKISIHNSDVINHNHNTSVNDIIKDYNKQNSVNKPKYFDSLRKSSISRSEMDIFNRSAAKVEEDDLDKHKSCEELPKINVKNVISIYESVSKVDVTKSDRKLSRESVHRKQSAIGSLEGPAIGTTKSTQSIDSASSSRSESKTSILLKSNLAKSLEIGSSNSLDIEASSRNVDSPVVEILSTRNLQQNAYQSNSDCEMVSPQTVSDYTDSSPELNEQHDQTGYKNRFKTAKQFFQSLEELREEKKPRKINECEMMLRESDESLGEKRPQKRVKKNIKAHSVPSNEISKYWKELQKQKENDSKLVKISEKFNVDDLFNDVMEGKLSRQGSLRGIPNKKAVLETFRSMENLIDNKTNSYEMSITQLKDFAKEKNIRNAQTYLSEYPYLPTTDPSKYQSRWDARATGLITLKELLKQKPRRNSVPDLRLNTKFTVDL